MIMRYKSNATILGVFLLVSLIVIFLMGWMLISGDYNLEKNTSKMTKEDALTLVEDRFNKTYQFVDTELFKTFDKGMDTVNFNMYCTYYSVSLGNSSNYFTDRVINRFKDKLYLINGSYYDCYNFNNSFLVNTIFSKNNTLNNEYYIESYNDNYIVASVKYSLSENNDLVEYSTIINLKLDNDRWLIDSFE